MSPAPTPPVPLDDIVITDEIATRPVRTPDHHVESQALVALMRRLREPGADDTILQDIAEAALSLCRAGSAGVGILEADGGGGEFLRWHGAAGWWSSHRQGSMPRRDSPCDAVVTSGLPLLMRRPERRYPLGSPGLPPLQEMLLVPVSMPGGQHVGALWLAAHDEARRFDAEDLRLLNDLADVASVACRLMQQGRQLRQSLDHERAGDALRKADQRKNEFLAVLGHELRNPLAPLSTGIELLRRGGQTPEFLDRLYTMMGRQVSHLTRLVDDLLDLSRIDRGELELRQAHVDLRNVVDAAVDLARPVIERGRHTLSVELDGQPLPVEGDPQRLTQVVANLLTNAAKYTEPGGRIVLSARLEGQATVLRVADTGFGIPPQALQSIFDMFSQVPEHREHRSRRGAGGLGIGLALSRRLAELHRGSLTAHSEGLGQGSEFSLRLPPSAAQPATPAEPPHATAMPAPCRILVVDDNIDAATSLRTALQLDRHEVEVAYDGAQALALAESFAPQALLIDIDLPGMDGYELARRLRERDPGRRLLLAAVTGWGQGDDREQALAAGFDLHLTKPVRIDDLNAALAQVGQAGRNRASTA